MYQIFYEESGTAAIEYGLLISLIAMSIAGFIQILGGNIFEIFMTIDKIFSSVQMHKTS